MDWVDLISSESVEEREEDMFSLAAGFPVRMCKLAASAQREIASGSEGLGGKRLKWFGPDEKA